jgi:hypothetical protein
MSSGYAKFEKYRFHFKLEYGTDNWVDTILKLDGLIMVASQPKSLEPLIITIAVTIDDSFYCELKAHVKGTLLIISDESLIKVVFKIFIIMMLLS